MMKLSFSTLIIAFFFACSSTAREYNRNCRTDELSPHVKTAFQLDFYTGLWYEIGRYDTSLWPLNCVQARYNRVDGEVKVINSGFANNGTLIEFEGKATIAEPNVVPLPAKLNVTFFSGQDPTIYWILSTDYSSYSLVWSCIPLSGNRSREQAWILSRTRELSVASAIRINNLIEQNNLNLETMEVTEQDINVCMRGTY